MTNNGEAGTNLAKVLWYYNLLPDVQQPTYKIVCPFHADVNPSMIVNLVDGNWYCFGCNLSGDAYKFVRLMEPNSGNDIQMMRRYIQVLKSDKASNITVNAQQLAKAKKPSRQVYNEAYDYYFGLRTPDWRNDEDDEVVRARDYMLDRGFSTEALGLCRAKVTYNHTYGLIFPMIDNGKFRGWVCRTMLREIEKKRKYLYNEGFARATTLVGNYGSKPYVIVVEGYMDRLKFLQFGIDNVVAILGWKMSPQQIDKLKRSGVVRIISALDNDQYGRQGTDYLRYVFGKSNVLRFCYLRGVKDPGDMDKKSFAKMYSRTLQQYKKEFDNNGTN